MRTAEQIGAKYQKKTEQNSVFLSCYILYAKFPFNFGLKQVMFTGTVQGGDYPQIKEVLVVLLLVINFTDLVIL